MKKENIALQVYSVRGDMEKDFFGTLRAVKEMGYAGVEFAGLYGNDPKEIKAFCEEIGLVPLSAHVPFQELMADMDGTIAQQPALIGKTAVENAYNLTHGVSIPASIPVEVTLVTAANVDTYNDAPAEDTGDDAAQEETVAPAGGELKFTTGGDQGTYYGFGTVLAGQVSGATGTTVTAITSGGSKANIETMEAGDAQLGFVQSDVMAYAYNGTSLFEGAPVEGFSTVAALYMEQVQIVTLDPSIQTVADLAGKNVSIGAAGSGVYFNALDILAAYDLTVEDITPTFEDFGNSVESLQDGKIDAAFIVAGAPTTAVTSLATSKDVYLVSLDDAHIDTLKAACPYYDKSVIAADTYGMPGDVTTVAVGAVVIANDSVAEDDVYNFVSTIFENVDTITEQHGKGAELDLEFASSITDVPYHAGAAKYFAEKGIEVAAVK